MHLPVNAATLENIQQLISQSNYQSALSETETLIASGNQTPEILFTKGVILQQSGKRQEAVKIYQRLIKQHPQYSEPYNNLALHYAQSGDLDAAVKTLEQAIRSHPSIATAYQNLTAIYNRMASEAYRKALNSKKPPVALELSALDRLSTPSSTSNQENLIVANNNATNVLTSQPAVSSSNSASSEASQAEAALAQQTAAVEKTPVLPVPEVVVEEKQIINTNVVAVTEKSPAIPETSNVEKEAVIQRVFSWAEAWSDRDVERYLSHYSPNFVPRNITLSEWKEQRHGRLRWREFIIVKPSRFSVAITGKEATVNFSQYYKSDRFEDTIRKTLKLEKRGKDWLITRELI